MGPIIYSQYIADNILIGNDAISLSMSYTAKYTVPTHVATYVHS